MWSKAKSKLSLAHVPAENVAMLDQHQQKASAFGIGLLMRLLLEHKDM